MLSQRFPEAGLRKILSSRKEWRPYPTASERPGWVGLPDGVRGELIAAGEKRLGCEWPPIPAARFMDFVRDGNRSRYEALSFGRRAMLAQLVLAECAEHHGRFMEDVVNGIWAICEESFWGVPAHVGKLLPDTQRPVVDLFAAETSALLAWTCYLLGDELEAVTPAIRTRVYRETVQRILTPLIERDDFGWMGLRGQTVNNWNPWICSNWLTTVLLQEDAPDTRIRHVAKCLRCLDRFIDPYPADGGCDEGPSYWGRAGAALFDCLEILRSATDDPIDVYNEPLIQEIGRFIARVHIAEDWFVNFADAPARTVPPAAVVYGYGLRIGDDALREFGAWLGNTPGLQRRSKLYSLGRALPRLFTFAEMRAEPGAPNRFQDSWLPVVQVLTCRDEGGSEDGWFLAAKGGHNAESHNHNDVGSFIVYRNGCPLIVDAGVETYTRKTFSRERYTIWTMQSAYHTMLPTVDGVMQAPGGKHRAADAACTIGEDATALRLDVAPAYPPDAAIARWIRTVTLLRGEGVDMTDEFELQQDVAEIAFSILTPADVHLEAGHIRCTGRDLPDGRRAAEGTVAYDFDTLSADVEQIPLSDTRLPGVWGDHLTRIVLTWTSPPHTGTLHLQVRA